MKCTDDPFVELGIWTQRLQRNSPHRAAHKAPIIAMWATPLASHGKCWLVHQHKQLKNKRGKHPSACLKCLAKEGKLEV